MIEQDKIWDVVVVGGGPAGMMAAGRAGARGASVLLLEKNDRVGKKLLTTGGGRCNVLNNKPDVRTLLAKYVGSDKFLFSAFSQYGVKETLEFFNSRGMVTKEENDGRMFPVSDSARSVWQVMVDYMKEGGVEVRKNVTVKGLSFDKEKEIIEISVSSQKEAIRARQCVVSTGGTSHPETGSTGDGLKWLESLGHKIVKNDFALVPVVLSDSWAKKLSGLALSDIKVGLYCDGVRKSAHIGRVLFTHFGLSGPMILNLAWEIGEMMNTGEVVLSLDLFPKLDEGALRRQIQEYLVLDSNKKIKNVVGAVIPATIVSSILKLAEFDGETPCHSVTSEERKRLVGVLKNIPLHVKGLLGSNKAIVSAGGVALEEVDFKTMQSRLIKRLYLVGDILNINRPSGGYSLQLCWTTGFVAGENVAILAKLDKSR